MTNKDAAAAVTTQQDMVLYRYRPVDVQVQAIASLFDYQQRCMQLLSQKEEEHEHRVRGFWFAPKKRGRIERRKWVLFHGQNVWEKEKSVVSYNTLESFCSPKGLPVSPRGDGSSIISIIMYILKYDIIWFDFDAIGKVTHSGMKQN